jgi:hypothetical protein
MSFVIAHVDKRWRDLRMCLNELDFFSSRSATSGLHKPAERLVRLRLILICVLLRLCAERKESLSGGSRESHFGAFLGTNETFRFHADSDRERDSICCQIAGPCEYAEAVRQRESRIWLRLRPMSDGCDSTVAAERTRPMGEVGAFDCAGCGSLLSLAAEGRMRSAIREV